MRIPIGMGAFIELFFTSNACCIGCGSCIGTDEMWLCGECLNQLCRTDDILLRQDASWPSSGVSASLSVYRYRRPIRGFIHALKYSGVYAVSDWAAARMAESLADWKDIHADCLVPVPMHKQRMRERGYNQAELLARAIGEKTGIPVIEALVRAVNTKQQALSSKSNRYYNVKGAFGLAESVDNMSILLIDDVITSGATANACAACLRSGGASEVNLLTLATGHY